jgi:hypothetical protein
MGPLSREKTLVARRLLPFGVFRLGLVKDVEIRLNIQWTASEHRQGILTGRMNLPFSSHEAVASSGSGSASACH